MTNVALLLIFIGIGACLHNAGLGLKDWQGVAVMVMAGIIYILAYTKGIKDGLSNG